MTRSRPDDPAFRHLYVPGNHPHETTSRPLHIVRPRKMKTFLLDRAGAVPTTSCGRRWSHFSPLRIYVGRFRAEEAGDFVPQCRGRRSLRARPGGQSIACSILPHPRCHRVHPAQGNARRFMCIYHAGPRHDGKLIRCGDEPMRELRQERLRSSAGPFRVIAAGFMSSTPTSSR